MKRTAAARRLGALLAGTVLVVAALCATAPAQAAGRLPAIEPRGPGLNIPGSFPWFDLITDDLTASRVFYGAVFGWTFRSLGSGEMDYTVISLNGHPIGGMLVPAGRRPVAARWLPLISVADPAVAARFTQLRGGKVLVAPADVPDRGIHAVLSDPQGAVFGVLHSSSGDPPDAPVADGDFFWVDLFTTDPAKAADFYSRLAGYDEYESPTAIRGVDRLVLAAAGYARAGIVPLPAPQLRPGWLPYVQVDNVGAALSRATHAGGRVVVAPSPGVLDGQLAVIADPRGGLIGIVDWIDAATPPGAGK